METIPISTQLLNSIVGYLGTRPYQEVFQMIKAIQDEAAKKPNTPPAE